MSETFSATPLQNVIPSYLYLQYSDDEALQAFIAAFNSLSQSYLNWFNSIPLAVYTSPYVSGALLDWIGQGLYGIARPTLSTSSVTRIAGYGTGVYGEPPAYGEQIYSASGTSELASDDIYKRVLTWHLYRGDGQQFTTQWLKNRVARFLYGANGADYAVLNSPPSVAVSGTTFTVTTPASASATALQECVNNGILALPFQYSFTVVT